MWTKYKKEEIFVFNLDIYANSSYGQSTILVFLA